VTTDERSGRQGRALRAPAGLGLDGREHGDNIRVRRGSEYSIKTLQNADEKHGASTDFLNRCTWYLIPSCVKIWWPVYIGCSAAKTTPQMSENAEKTSSR